MQTAEYTMVADEQGVQRFCRHLAAHLRGGETILLHGTLGMGKTTFARALIQSLCGTATEVASPTFTLMQEYDAQSGFPIAHYDLYRIEHPEELYEMGLEEVLGQTLVLVEWPEVAADFFPAARLDITFHSEDASGTQRRLQLAAQGDMVTTLEATIQQWEQSNP